MVNKTLSADGTRYAIEKGVFKPHIYLTNLSMAYFQESAGGIARRIFPMVPVPLSTAKFYEFDKASLARPSAALKPSMGHVQPKIYSRYDQTYDCKVYQSQEGIDSIAALNYQRTNTPGAVDPRRGKARRLMEDLHIFMDDMWGQKYFNPASWSFVYRGVDASPTDSQFIRFDNDNSTPVAFFLRLITFMRQNGLRRPNKICMGMNVFAALQNNADILERIKYQGSEANPANVTKNVLAQLFGVDEVFVAETVVNRAPATNTGGDDWDPHFCCNPNSLLLCYTTNAPAIDEPSAGYTFTWDMLGNGQYLAVQQFLGYQADHAEFIEALLAFDQRITAPDLGIFLEDCVSAPTTIPR